MLDYVYFINNGEVELSTSFSKEDSQSKFPSIKL